MIRQLAGLAALAGVAASFLVWAVVFQKRFRRTATYQVSGYKLPLIYIIGLSPLLIEVVGSGLRRPVVALVEAVSVLAVARSIRRGHGPGNALWWGAMALTGPLVLSGVFGTKPELVLGVFLLPLVLSALAIGPWPDPRIVARHVLLIAHVYVTGSLIQFVIRPSAAIDDNYQSLAFLPPFRLQGLTPNGNLLGSFAALAVVLGFAQRRRSRWETLGLCLAVVVLVLAQGKTAWVACAAASLVVWVFSSHAHVATVRAVRLSVAGLVLAGCALFVLSGGAQDWALKLSNDSQDLSTFNSRTEVWTLTLKEFENNRLLGYGPAIWGPEYHRDLPDRLAYAGQAHNQFVQSLGESGAIGFVGLMAYLVALLSAARSARVATAGASLALVVLLVVRMGAEASLRNLEIDPAAGLHILIFSYVAAAAWAKRTAAKGGRSAPPRIAAGTSAGWSLEESALARSS